MHKNWLVTGHGAVETPSPPHTQFGFAPLPLDGACPPSHLSQLLPILIFKGNMSKNTGFYFFSICV